MIAGESILAYLSISKKKKKMTPICHLQMGIDIEYIWQGNRFTLAFLKGSSWDSFYIIKSNSWIVCGTVVFNVMNVYRQ